MEQGRITERRPNSLPFTQRLRKTLPAGSVVEVRPIERTATQKQDNMTSLYTRSTPEVPAHGSDVPRVSGPGWSAYKYWLGCISKTSMILLGIATLSEAIASNLARKLDMDQ